MGGTLAECSLLFFLFNQIVNLVETDGHLLLDESIFLINAADHSKFDGSRSVNVFEPQEIGVRFYQCVIGISLAIVESERAGWPTEFLFESVEEFLVSGY